MEQSNQQKPSSDTNLETNKIEMRAYHMSYYHKMAFSFVLIVSIVISLFLGVGMSEQMLRYDESEIYSCPQDFAGNAAWHMTEQEADNLPQPDKHLSKNPFGQV